VHSYYLNQGKISENLKKFWEPVLHLIIDEVSMLTASDLAKIDLQLQLLKGNNEKFGSISISVHGDFFQNPPVGGQEIWKPPTSQSNGNNLNGYTLWNTYLNYVVMFQEDERSKNDQTLKEIKKACRNGNLINFIDELNSRYVGDQNLNLDFHIPVVYYSNTKRIQFNLNATFLHAQQLKQQVIKIEAQFQKKGSNDISLNELKNLYTLPEHECEKLPPILYTFKGQLVMISANSCIEYGAINGSEGIVEGFGLKENQNEEIEVIDPLNSEKQYRVNKMNYIQVIYVKINNSDLIFDPALEPGVVPIFRVTKSIQCYYRPIPYYPCILFNWT